MQVIFMVLFSDLIYNLIVKSSKLQLAAIYNKTFI